MARTTQTSEILHYLKTHKGITSMQAFEKFGATRLSGIIYNLRAKGHHIISVDKTGTNRYGEHVSFVEYRLIKPAKF